MLRSVMAPSQDLINWLLAQPSTTVIDVHLNEDRVAERVTEVKFADGVDDLILGQEFAPGGIYVTLAYCGVVYFFGGRVPTVGYAEEDLVKAFNDAVALSFNSGTY